MRNPKSIAIFENEINSYVGKNVDADIISFKNEDNDEFIVEQERVTEVIKTFTNRDKIKRLCIDYSSCFADLEFLYLFPNLESLRIDSPRITNLSGIEKLPNLNSFKFAGNMKKKRNIAGIEKFNIEYLSVHLKKSEDLEIIAKCRTVSSLHLYGPFEIDFTIFEGFNLNKLVLVNSKQETISDLNGLNLERLEIAYCTKLVSFGDGNDKLKKLEVQSCNKLDLNTIPRLSNLVYLTFRSRRNITDLNFILELKKLKGLTITASPLSKADLSALITSESLQDVWLSANNKIVKELAKANTKLIISNGDYDYFNGEEISLEEYQKISLRLGGYI